MIEFIAKQIIKMTTDIMKPGINSDYYTDAIVSKINHLTLIPASTPDAIRDKLLVLINTGWLVVSDMRVLLDYVEAWTYRDYEFIKNNSMAVLAMLNHEAEHETDGEWLLLLGSVELDIKRFLTDSNRREQI